MSKIYCSNCGQLTPPNDNFCTHCGAAQRGQESAMYRAQDAPVDTAEAPKTPISQDIVPIPKSQLSATATLFLFVSFFGKTSILVPALIVGIYFYPVLFAPLLGAVLLIMFIVALLYNNNFWYEIDEAGLTIESGIIHKKHVTVPFEQVQNVNIERSLLDRLFGLAKISIETAGSSNVAPQTVAGAPRARSEAYLPGIELKKAKIIHDTLIDGASDAR